MNTKADLTHSSLKALIERFADIGVKQYDAELHDDIPRYNRLMDQMRAIDIELRRRGPDARHALVSLFDHPNIQVRLKAATLSLAVAPEAAHATLQKIIDSKSYPQAADAAMTYPLIERGIFKPD